MYLEKPPFFVLWESNAKLAYHLSRSRDRDDSEHLRMYPMVHLWENPIIYPLNALADKIRLWFTSIIRMLFPMTDHQSTIVCNYSCASMIYPKLDGRHVVNKLFPITKFTMHRMTISFGRWHDRACVDKKWDFPCAQSRTTCYWNWTWDNRVLSLDLSTNCFCGQTNVLPRYLNRCSACPSC